MFHAAGAFLALFAFNVRFPYIVLGAGLAGLIGGRLAPATFRIGGAPTGAHANYGPALIDDDTPSPAHARFKWARVLGYAFVGFVGAWSAEPFGAHALFAAGAAGAAVATFFTFLPSFLFILLGAPAVERTRGDITFTAPLTGITAAVVGVVLNLAVFFAYHVLWPAGFAGDFEGFALLIGVAALVALGRFRIGVMPVIAGAAGGGLLYVFLRQPLGG